MATKRPARKKKAPARKKVSTTRRPHDRDDPPDATTRELWDRIWAGDLPVPAVDLEPCASCGSPVLCAQVTSAAVASGTIAEHDTYAGPLVLLEPAPRSGYHVGERREPGKRRIYARRRTGFVEHECGHAEPPAFATIARLLEEHGEHTGPPVPSEIVDAVLSVLQRLAMLRQQVADYGKGDPVGVVVDEAIEDEKALIAGEMHDVGEALHNIGVVLAPLQRIGPTAVQTIRDLATKLADARRHGSSYEVRAERDRAKRERQEMVERIRVAREVLDGDGVCTLDHDDEFGGGG